MTTDRITCVCCHENVPAVEAETWSAPLCQSCAGALCFCHEIVLPTGNGFPEPCYCDGVRHARHGCEVPSA